MDAALTEMLRKQQMQRADSSEPRNTAAPFDKLNLLSSLSFLAGTGAAGRAPESPSAPAPVTPTNTDKGDSLSDSIFAQAARKRSYHELLSADLSSFSAADTLSPKRSKTIETLSFPSKPLQQQQQQQQRHVPPPPPQAPPPQLQQQQQQQQQQQLPTADELSSIAAASFASSSFLNLLLAQNALNKSFQGGRSLFQPGVFHGSKRRASDVFSVETELSSLEGDDSKRKSNYRGVIWDKNSRAWRAKLSVKGKLMHVGLFEDEKEAAIAWDKKAIEVRGHKTRLNFPELVQDLYRIELTSRRIRKRT